MNDYQIRTALKQKLFSRHLSDPDTIIFDELGLRHGLARIDLVVVNSILHGFELKSDRDTLARLPNQARIYNSVLDHVTLVVGNRHADKALAIVPEWWGMILVDKRQCGEIHFSEIRQPHNNPSPDILAIAKLLWRKEALVLLEEFGATDGFRYKPRSAIYARLVDVVDLDLLRSKVRYQLKNRTNWRSDEQQMLNGD